MIIAIDAHCSCAPTLTGKMEQNLHINGYTRHFSPYFSLYFSVEFFEEQSRITQQVGMIVLAGHVLKNCTRYRIIRLFRMFKKVQLISMGHPNVRRSVISVDSLLRKSNDHHGQRVLCFNSRLSYHIIPQVVRSFNVTGSNGLLRNTCSPEFYFISQQKSQNGYKIVKEVFLEECLLFWRVTV